MQDHHLNEHFSLNLLLRMLNLIKAALVFLGILSLSTTNSLALAPEWKVYRDVFEKGDCARIIRELGAIQHR